MKKTILLLCFILISISLTAQVGANPAPDLFACDLNNDGFEVFDLTVNDAVIIGSQNPAEVQITYYTNLVDAQNGTNTIANPTNFISVGQTIFAKLEDIGTGDFDITQFLLIINPTPNATIPTPLELCDDNNDGFAEFDLTIKNAEIGNGELDLIITFHETLIDAEDGTFVLGDTYENIVENTQTIYVRVENSNSGCYAIVELQLIVNPTPEITQPTNLFIDEGDGDSFAIFDLTVKIPEILGGLNPSEYAVYFYEAQADAEINANPIATPEFFGNTSNPQTIYVRVESFATGCFALTSFEILTDQAAPDADGDGIANEDEDLNNNGNLNDDDTDGDGIPNYLDNDDDGDSVSTIDEITGIGAGVAPSTYTFIDTDGDGIENYLDNDDDGDGTLTKDEDYNNNGTPKDDDTNNNNIPDFLDDEVFLSVKAFNFEDMSVYPNPTSKSFTLQSSELVSETAISIYDIQGKMLLSEKMLPQNGTLTLDVSVLENGVYFLKISSEGNTAMKKIIKE